MKEELAPTARKTLVILSSKFPAQTGDTAFLQHEIGVLAETFDEVLVFSFFPLQGGTDPVQLPHNVEYLGALSTVPRTGGVAALANPWGLARAFKAVWREARAGRIRGRLRLTLGNVFTGGRLARQIARGIPEEGETLVYSFWGTDAAMALPFLPRKHRKAVRFHRYDLYEDEDGGLPLRASILAASDHLLPISEDGERYLAEHYGSFMDQGKVTLARLGTADRGIGPEPVTEEPWTVVSCSYVSPVKRVDLILAALQETSQDYPIRWVHFGGGHGLEELRAAAEEGQRRFPSLAVDLRGNVPNFKVLDFYKNNPVNVFVNLSSSEGVPVSIMEALSFGIPVVATDVGGTAELVNEGLATGILLPADPTAAGAAEAIRAACVSDSFSPRDAWEQHADASRHAEALAALLGVGPTSRSGGR